MLSEPELKRRVGFILSIEENGIEADWFAITKLSKELLDELPEFVPAIVRAYLTDSDVRQKSKSFANEQLSALVLYLRGDR